MSIARSQINNDKTEEVYDTHVADVEKVSLEKGDVMLCEFNEEV